MSTISEMIEKCSDDAVVRLDKDYSEAVVTPHGRRFTIDLGGHTWTAPAKSTPLTVEQSVVTVRNGFIVSKDNAAVRVGGKNTEACKAVLETTLSIQADGHVCVFLGKNAELDTSASMTTLSENGVIQGNGTAPFFGNICRVRGGRIVSEKGVAIYWPQEGDLYIEGGYIEGASTAVEVRAGTVTMTGGTVKGLGTPAEFLPNGAGSTSTGAGIAISQHTTKLPIRAKVTGGTVEGHTPFYESNPQGNAPEDVAKISIELGGKAVFEPINGGTVAVYSEDVKGIIKGGTYKGAVSEDLVSSGFVLELLPDGRYGVTDDAWFMPDQGVAGGGFVGLRRLVLTKNSLDYKAGGIDVPLAGLKPIMCLSASARGGVAGWYDTVNMKLHLYRNGTESDDRFRSLTVILIGY